MTKTNVHRQMWGMIGNKTIIENVFLHDLNQYINDHIMNILEKKKET
jgi:hypothetical protein